MKIGDRVQMHPATDAWMQGDRYGELLGVGPVLVTVKFDKSGRVKRVRRADVEVVA